MARPSAGLLRSVEGERATDAAVRAHPLHHGGDLLHRGERQGDPDVERLASFGVQLVVVLLANVRDGRRVETVAGIAVAFEPLQRRGRLARAQPGDLLEAAGQLGLVAHDQVLCLSQRRQVHGHAAVVHLQVEEEPGEDLGRWLHLGQLAGHLALDDNVLAAVGDEGVPGFADGHAPAGDREAPVPGDVVFEDRTGAGALELLPFLVGPVALRRQQIDGLVLVGEDADQGFADGVLLVAQLEELRGLGERRRGSAATAEKLGTAPLLQRRWLNAELAFQHVLADRRLEADVEGADRGTLLHRHAKQVERLAGLRRVRLVDAPDHRVFVVLGDGEQQDARARIAGVAVASAVDRALRGGLEVEAVGRHVQNSGISLRSRW